MDLQASHRSPFDWHLVIPILLLVAFGLVMVSSASIGVTASLHVHPMHFFLRQCAHVGLGLMLMLLASRLSVTYLHQGSTLAVLLGLGLLTLVLIPPIGKIVNGSARWISLGVLNIQVSEVVKLLLLIYIASYLTRRGDEVKERFIGVLKPFMVLGVFCVLLLFEPDLGSCVVLAGITLGMMFVGMMPLRYVLLLMALGVCLFFILVYAAPYRLERLLSFQNPWQYSMHQGYQLTHSLMAIGSGGFFGVGIGQSLQRLSYLPEAHTDFIFSVICEELGWFGAFVMLGIYSWLFVRMWIIAKLCLLQNKPFRSFLVWGVLLWVCLQVLIHMGVCLGMLPTKGMTLPLISYGGSSLLACLFAFGMVHQISREVTS
ncbi:MAG: putative lipid II flippase FtsW [Gammaproteobacteria bacterium]|nr:putative lipid II flippase FtsW [Gammaproteobacteria bacterium]